VGYIYTMINPPRRPATTEHNYIPAVADYYKRHPLTPGHIVELNVEHEDDCDVFREGYCNCIVTLRKREYKQ